jgi:flagellar protein FliS
MSNPQELRARYLRERVLTASPAQRVAMLYDRLALDLRRAADSEVGKPSVTPGLVPTGVEHLDHAIAIVVELRASLDHTAGEVADNLASLYSYLIGEVLAVRGGSAERLAGAMAIVEQLRGAWTEVAASMSSGAGARPGDAVAWVS